MDIEGKYNIEINFVGDGRIFLNFWDYVHGNDVVAQVIDGELIYKGRKILMEEYIKLVKESISLR